MILFTQSTAVLDKYLNETLLQFFSEVTEFPEFSMFREITEYSRFVATLCGHPKCVYLQNLMAA